MTYVLIQVGDMAVRALIACLTTVFLAAGGLAAPAEAPAAVPGEAPAAVPAEAPAAVPGEAPAAGVGAVSGTPASATDRKPVAAPEPEREVGLILEQRSNGIPGKEKSASAPHILKIGGGGIRVEEKRKGARVVIVRLDREVYWELDPDRQLYTEMTFARFRKKRERAEKEREEARRLALTQFKDRPEKLAQFLNDKGLRADGKRILVHNRLQDQKIGAWSAVRHTLSVNGRVYLDVWATDAIDEYEPPAELYAFYDRCGLLPANVTAALRRVEGFPVRLLATLNYYSMGTTLDAEVQAVMAWPVDRSAFEIPEGFTRVEKFPGTEESVSNSCPVCGEAKKLTTRPPGVRMYVCSRVCALEVARDPRKYKKK